MTTITCSFHLQVIIEVAAVTSASWVQSSHVPRVFSLDFFFFFSLIIPSEVDGCLLCDTWEIIWQWVQWGVARLLCLKTGNHLLII